MNVLVICCSVQMTYLLVYAFNTYIVFLDIFAIFILLQMA